MLKSALHSDTVSSVASSKFLVIGYGNPLHSDDGIGSQVVALLEAQQYPNVRTIAMPYLRPELSGRLAAATHVIFVDACKTGIANGPTIQPITAYGVETSGASIPALGHGCDPGSLLALTASAYGRVPQAWWVKVPASDFGEGTQLSSLAEAGVMAALGQINAFICQMC